MTIKLTLDNTEIQELMYATQAMFEKLIDSDPDRAETYSALHDKLFDVWSKQDD